MKYRPLTAVNIILLLCLDLASPQAARKPLKTRKSVKVKRGTVPIFCARILCWLFFLGLNKQYFYSVLGAGSSCASLKKVL